MPQDSIQERYSSYSVARSLEQDEVNRLLVTPRDFLAYANERRSYLGATDIAPILGLSPWKTPRMVWLEKQGLTGGSPPSEVMVHGLNLEAYVAHCYTRLTGRPVGRGGFCQDCVVPYFGATPDYVVTGDLALVECKTAGFWASKEFGSMTDAVPLHYVIQCMWQMAVTDTGRCDLAVLIAGQEFRVYEIPRDDELITELRRRAQEWWETYMLAEVPPPLTDSPLDSEALDSLHPSDNGITIEADEEGELLCANLLDARTAKKRATAHEQGVINRVKELMGDAASLHSSLGYVNWRTSEDGKRRFLLKLGGDISGE